MKKIQISKLKFQNHGFTLIEMVIYVSIVTIILTFSLLTAYNLIDADERVMAKKELVENQKFLEQKIGWLLQSVSAINTPVIFSTSSSLSVNKLNYSLNPLIISVSGGVARLVSGATTTPISNGFALVDSLVFYYATTGIMKVSAILSNKTGTTSIETSFSFR